MNIYIQECGKEMEVGGRRMSAGGGGGGESAQVATGGDITLAASRQHLLQARTFPHNNTKHSGDHDKKHYALYSHNTDNFINSLTMPH